jgi:ParB family transcriptional regulator, chromosome partitioning protein
MKQKEKEMEITPPHTDAPIGAAPLIATVAMGAPGSSEPQQDAVRRAIKEVSGLLDARADAVRSYFRRATNDEAQKQASQMVLRVEIDIGNALIRLKKVGLLGDGRAGPGTKYGRQKSPLTLTGVGVTNQQSKDWQRLARMSDEEREALFADPPRPTIGGPRSSSVGPSVLVPIASIVIGQRHRKDLGDIAGLAANIAEIGLLHPIVVRADGTLIAGERRLEAYKLLGRTEIPVTIVDLDKVVLGEFGENTERKDFTWTEAVAIKRALEPIEKAAAKERQAAAGPKAGKGKKASGGGKLPQAVKGKSRDKAAKATGKKARTLSKAEAVIAAAEAQPEKFGHLPQQMDETGKVDRAFREIQPSPQSVAKPASLNGSLQSPQPKPAPELTESAADPVNRELVSSDADALVTQEPAPATQGYVVPPTAPTEAAPPDAETALDGDADLPPVTLGEKSRRKLSLDEVLANMLFVLETQINSLVSDMRAEGRLPELFRRVRKLVDKLEAAAALDAAIDRAAPVEQPATAAAPPNLSAAPGSQARGDGRSGS